MLSYRHAFHAGNHADVLKHILLVALLDLLTAKAKPLRYVDSHGGAGGYSLHSPLATRNREFEHGVAQVWSAENLPPAIADYRRQVALFNGVDGQSLNRYPGSPWLAAQYLREGDSAYLFELHPTYMPALQTTLADYPAMHVRRGDGLAGMIGMVPPPERRGLVFIDPPYELGGEDRAVGDAVGKCLRRFATGVYAVWYPVIERRRVQSFERAIFRLGAMPMTTYELCVAPDRIGAGMTGSGVIVINPPWGLRERMEPAMAWLAQHLARAGDGKAAIRESAAR